MKFNLTKKAPVNVYQVEMELQRKNTKSPFVAILLLAMERGYEGESITAGALRLTLMPALAERACGNLLQKLKTEGYLEDSDYDDGFKLSDKGFASAEQKAYWIGERGVYDVYVYDNPLAEEKILHTERKKIADNVANTEFKPTPEKLKSYIGTEVKIGNEEVRIESMEKKCLPRPDVEAKITITADGADTKIQISHAETVLTDKPVMLTANELFEKLTEETKEFDYDSNRNAVLVKFDKADLQTTRQLTIQRPLFMSQAFQEVKVAEVLHLPQTNTDAQKWYENLLVAKIDRHFLNEEDFTVYSNEIASVFKDYKVKQLKREDLINTLSADKKHFYQRAFLETSNYLKY
ncbi:MAG TPA: hypothetical protein VK174_12940 [Chitinophagales bacterium]|nr:hypothetical protein [Chitinophagales bacterium]